MHRRVDELLARTRDTQMPSMASAARGSGSLEVEVEVEVEVEQELQESCKPCGRGSSGRAVRVNRKRGGGENLWTRALPGQGLPYLEN